jgi:dedicated sortase system histidine kinase
MSLRLQLLALGGVLILLLPWAGLRFVEATEASLRENHEKLLLQQAGRVVIQVGDSDELAPQAAVVPGFAPALYAQTLRRAPGLDGYRSDWEFARVAPGADDDAMAVPLADGSRAWLGVYPPFLFLFVEVVDDEIVYQTVPGRPPHGDRVVVLLPPGRDSVAPRALLLPSIAPGVRPPSVAPANLRAQKSIGPDGYESTGEYDDNVLANWQRSDGGYTVEARVPIEAAIGIGIVDTDAGGSSVRLAGATWGAGETPNALIREWPELVRILSPFAGGGERYRVIDPEGWVLADSGPLDLSIRAAEADSPSPTEKFFRYLLRRDDPAYSTLESRPGRIGDPALLAAMAGEGGTAWFGIGNEASAVVTAAVPIRTGDTRQGAVLLEQASDPVMSMQNDSTRRLMATTVLVSVIVAGLLLGYASYLSIRIGRLARAAESALGPEGEIRAALPGTRARDAIGVLARSFEDLLGRLRDYTQYLQSLKSKLSHELRTPLAIVATSLDNLEQETSTDAGRAYLARLRHGTGRLESILQAMTAATRVEQAVTQTNVERFDLSKVISACVAAYGDAWSGQRFEAAVPTEPVWVQGSPELIEQLLDKLVDNAMSFAVAGSAIEVSLVPGHGEAALAVVNRGPLLPEAMRHRLFDSLVSVRASGGERAHLGLGLYIVTLIARFHGGRVEADNLPDGSGVRIGVVLPIA